MSNLFFINVGPTTYYFFAIIMIKFLVSVNISWEGEADLKEVPNILVFVCMQFTRMLKYKSWSIKFDVVCLISAQRKIDFQVSYLSLISESYPIVQNKIVEGKNVNALD